MDNLDILTLAEAAELLNLAPSTLRAQVVNGRLQARKIGKTWVTSRAEVERYRRANLGRFGRPGMAEIVDELRWPANTYDARIVQVKAFADTPQRDLDRVVAAAREAIGQGAWTMAELMAPIITGDATREIPLEWRDNPPQIILVRIATPDETRVDEAI